MIYVLKCGQFPQLPGCGVFYCFILVLLHCVWVGVCINYSL